MEREFTIVDKAEEYVGEVEQQDAGNMIHQVDINERRAKICGCAQCRKDYLRSVKIFDDEMDRLAYEDHLRPDYSDTRQPDHPYINTSDYGFSDGLSPYGNIT